MSPIPTSECPDPFIMNENNVNLAVKDYLESCGAYVSKCAKDNQRGYDVEANINGYTLIVESKGTLKNNQHENVFDGGQIVSHIGAQMYYMMKEYEYCSDKTLLIIANPDIPRIRKGIDKVSLALDELGIIRFWVKANRSIEVEYPERKEHICQLLKLV